MSFLKKSLEKRIRELRQSIEAQTIELAAYEQVLALESGKPIALAAAPPEVAAVVKKHTEVLARRPASSTPPSTATVEFNGSRSDFVFSMLKQRGAGGVTPSEISAAFSSHKIDVSKNLVYNVLSLMFKQKKVRKSDGRYYLLPGGATAKAAPKKAVKTRSNGSDKHR